MKRSVLFLVSLLVVTTMVAAPVSQQRAMQVAQQFIPVPDAQAQAPAMRGEELPSDIVYTHPMPKSGQPAFYVVNVGGSFVIVSADDVAHQVLGYNLGKNWPVAANGEVQLPPQVKGFFDDLAAQMEAAIEADPNHAPDAEWSQPQSAPRRRMLSEMPDSVGPLLTTTWDQGQYYNALCPEDQNSPYDGHCPTGCVATAMAQVINYWGYPVHGRGIHSYNTNYGMLTVNYDSAYYDFDHMPSALTSISTQQEINAVGKLMYDCGVAVNMSYGSIESSSYDIEARSALVNFFHFSSRQVFAAKNYYTTSEWDSLIRSEIALGHPIFYGGNGDNNSAHAFVCDGYKSFDFYHFNFGWGGLADGWYSISSISPASQNYSSGQWAIFGIIPDSIENRFLGQMKGTSIFTIEEPTEFYGVLKDTKIESINYGVNCNHKVSFIPKNKSKQLVLDALSIGDNEYSVFDSIGLSTYLGRLSSNADNNDAPIISSQHGLTLSYLSGGRIDNDELCLLIGEEGSCQAVSDISFSIIDTSTIHLEWQDNGATSQWNIEYGLRGFPLGSGAIIATDSMTIEITGLINMHYYDFYIRSSCDTHGKKCTILVGQNWSDAVTQQPDGYYDDGNGNIVVSSAEGLAWWAKRTTQEGLLYGGSLPPLGRHSFNLTIDADIDLSGRIWKPVELYYWHDDYWHSIKNINGNGHVIKNMTIVASKAKDINNSLIGAGFISNFYGDTIKDLVFENPIIQSRASTTGTLVGSANATSIVNCGVINGIINSSSSRTGGLIGEICGCKDEDSCERTSIDNCFATGDITSTSGLGYDITGGLIGLAIHSNITNCYSAAKVSSFGGWLGGVCAYSSTNNNITNCYKIDSPQINYIEYSDVTSQINNYQSFQKDSMTLESPILIDEISCSDLISALNKGVDSANEGWRMWIAGTSNKNGGYPYFGAKQDIICKNVESLSAANLIINSINVLRLSWISTEGVSSWIIKYYEKDSLGTTATYLSADSNIIDIYGLKLGTTYKFFVKSVCDETISSGWGQGVEFLFERPYWTDVITSIPNGFTEDENGNVFISTVEGLSWLSSCVNGINGQIPNSYEGKSITILSDIDLSGYRWLPIGNSRELCFKGSVNGCNNSICNLYINEESDNVGLFGFVYSGQFFNVILKNGNIKGNNNVGGLCGYYASGYGWFDQYLFDDVLMDNCHAYNCNLYGTKFAGGLLGRTEDQGGIKIRNCSSSGNIYCWEGAGGVVGRWYSGSIFGYENGGFYNCYSTANIHDYVGYNYYAGGLSAYADGNIQNCYSSGEIHTTRSFSGQIIGVLDQNSSASYLYYFANSLINNAIGEFGENATATNISAFSLSNGETPISPSVTIGDSTFSDLLSALNAWVDVHNSDSIYCHWVADTAMVNGGFPIFAPMPVEPVGPGTEIDNYKETNRPARKVFERGHLYILLPDGTRFDATGRKVE